MNGGFTLNNGTVIVSGSKALGNGTLTINGGTIQSSSGLTYIVTSITIGGDFTFTGTGADIYTPAVSLGVATRTITNNITSGSRQFSGIISGNSGVGLTISGTGTTPIILSGANIYTGLTTVSGSTLQLNRTGGTTIPITNDININGGILKVSTNQTINNFSMTSGTLTVDANTTLTITGTYNVTGGIINNSGTIKLNGGATSFPGSGVTINNGTSNTITNLEIATSSDVIATLAFTVGGTLTLTSGKLTLGANNLTIGSTISGASATSYIVTNSTGALLQSVAASSSKTFPVGTASAYAPVTVANQDGTNADGYSALVASATAGSNSGADRVQLQWTVGRSGATVYAATFQWPGYCRGNKLCSESSHIRSII